MEIYLCDALRTRMPLGADRRSIGIEMVDATQDADTDDSQVTVLGDREVRDPRWQIMALLGERSTVRDGLKGRTR